MVSCNLCLLLTWLLICNIGEAQVINQQRTWEVRQTMQRKETQCEEESSNSMQQHALAIVPYEPPLLSRFHETEKSFRFGEHDVRIKQDWDSVGVAAVVWDAAVVLANYLLEQPLVVRHQCVLELGAGTGLSGIVAARIGAKTTVLTDREMALDILKENVILNNLELSQAPNRCDNKESSHAPVEEGNFHEQHGKPPNANPESKLESTRNVKHSFEGGEASPYIEVVPLNWGEELNPNYSDFDVILGADIIYIEDTFHLLLKTLLDLTERRKSNIIVLLSCKIRYERDERFLNMLRAHFTVIEVLYDKETDVHLYKASRIC